MVHKLFIHLSTIPPFPKFLTGRGSLIMYPLNTPVDLAVATLCHGYFASLPHCRLPALISLDQTETQDVGAWHNPPNSGREVPKEDWKTGVEVDAFATAQTDPIHR
jgi:hypothetical protein